MQVLAAGHEQLEQDAQQGDRSVAVREEHDYHYVAAPALHRHGQSAAATRTAGDGKPRTPKRKEHAGEGDVGDVRVELELPPEAAAQVADGAHIVLHRDQAVKGVTQIEIVPSDQSQGRILIPIPSHTKGKIPSDAIPIPSTAAMPAASAAAVETTGCAPQAARHRRIRAGQRQAAAMMTDAEMIASLAGCAWLPPTPATTPAQPAVAWEGDVSDRDLVAALAADAFASWQGAVDEVSDEQLAAALAGCAAETAEQLADTQMKHACLAPPSPDMEHWSPGGADLEHDDNPEIEHEDRVLEMALFHGTH
jgi:hypothetical protein